MRVTADQVLDLPGMVREPSSVLVLSVPNIHCAGCVSRIETGLRADPRFRSVRVNVTRRTVSVEPAALVRDTPRWRLEAAAVEVLGGIGYASSPLGSKPGEDPEGARLLRALAVAGFASMNVMLLSVSVWAGAEGVTRTFLHWIAALVAVPAVIYSGQPFYRSAWSALRRGGVNMDVPITLAVVLACGLSLYQTATAAHETYFDAAVMLLFFLLAGRTLDHFARRRMRASLREVISLMPRTAHVVAPDGMVTELPAEDVMPGQVLRIRVGDRVALDARLRSAGVFDLSHATGEVDPSRLNAGDAIVAGAVALDGPVDAAVLRPASDSFVMRLADLLRTAEEVRPRHLALADRAAAIYTPVVHFVALAAALGWLAAGAGPHQAITIAVATLIITCPCALGLAVPAVQTVAFDILYRSGIVAKDGAALERLREVDTVLLDKTGTLTVPHAGGSLDDRHLAFAAALAHHSSHPLSRALIHEAKRRELKLPPCEGVVETPGQGVSGAVGGVSIELGSGRFVRTRGSAALYLRIAGGEPLRVEVEERLRPGAQAVVDELKARGFTIRMVTGDRQERAARIADALGIQYDAALSPAQKLQIIGKLTESGSRILMVGDGINDGPALAAAHVSIAPGAATDLGRNTADIVLLHESLEGVALALDMAYGTNRHILQNFAVAGIYNLVAVPLAVLGVATPLHAAIAMSTSSILVTLNALRLRWTVRARTMR